MLEIIFSLICCYIILFIIAYKIKDNSIVDVFWGIGFLIISLLLIFQNNIVGIAQILSFILILAWSLRIALLIGIKKIKKPGEDRRYAGWRKEWKHFYVRSFFQVYILQMLLMLSVAIPLFVIFSLQGNNVLFTLVGSIIAAIGLSYETIADNQVKQFLQSKERPKNTIFTQGLWKYSRHPNYLGEAVFWLGISIISLQYSFVGIFGFVFITVLLLFVSGIPMKEESYKTKDNYNEYIKNTPIFVPKFSKK